MAPAIPTGDKDEVRQRQGPKNAEESTGMLQKDSLHLETAAACLQLRMCLGLCVGTSASMVIDSRPYTCRSIQT